MKTKRGDVVLVLFPNSDLHTAKRRPALVIQRDELSGGLAQTIVAMISSNLARRGHASRIFVSRDSAEGKAAGLRLDSVIMTDNLATILETEMDSVRSFVGYEGSGRRLETHAGIGLKRA